MTHNMGVITTTDKDVRDRLFEDLRMNGNELEKQVVKFSGNEKVLAADGLPVLVEVRYTAARKGGGTNHGKIQSRFVYQSNWSVAYPKS